MTSEPSAVTNLNNQLRELTNQVNQLPPDGGKDLRLSSQSAQNYIKLLQNHQQVLTDHLRRIPALADYGLVGNLASANSTLQNLKAATHHAAALLQKYVDYFGELEKYVTDALGQIVAQDSGIGNYEASILGRSN